MCVCVCVCCVYVCVCVCVCSRELTPTNALLVQLCVFLCCHCMFACCVERFGPLDSHAEKSKIHVHVHASCVHTHHGVI